MKNTKKKILSFLFICIFVLVPMTVKYCVLDATAQDLWDKQVGSGGELAQAFGQYDEPTDIRVIVAGIINVILGLLGLVFTVLIIYGGYLWMTAAGDEGKVTQAKKTLTQGTIGLAIILAAYSISLFVTYAIFRASNATD